MSFCQFLLFLFHSFFLSLSCSPSSFAVKVKSCFLLCQYVLTKAFTSPDHLLMTKPSKTSVVILVGVFHFTLYIWMFFIPFYLISKKKKRLNSICKRTKEKKQRIPMLLLWCLLLLFLLCNVVIESLDRQEEKTDRKQKYLHIMFFTYIIYIYTHIEERSKKPCTHIQCH